MYYSLQTIVVRYIAFAIPVCNAVGQNTLNGASVERGENGRREGLLFSTVLESRVSAGLSWLMKWCFLMFLSNVLGVLYNLHS